MDFAVVLIAAVVVIALSLLAMAVGVILRGRTFKSCGCASVTVRGEKIRCPGCVDSDDEEDAESSPPVGCRKARESEREPVGTAHD